MASIKYYYISLNGVDMNMATSATSSKGTMGGLIATERSLPDNLWMERKVRKKYV
jgi:hypothetical protein